MLTQKVSTIDELLQFVSTLRQKHGVRLWFRGEENADLTLIPSIQRSQALMTGRLLSGSFRETSTGIPRILSLPSSSNL